MPPASLFLTLRQHAQSSSLPARGLPAALRKLPEGPLPELPPHLPAAPGGQRCPVCPGAPEERRGCRHFPALLPRSIAPCRRQIPLRHPPVTRQPRSPPAGHGFPSPPAMLIHGGPPLRRLPSGVAACPPPPQEKEEEVSRPAGPSPCPHLPGRGRAVLQRSGARGRRVLRLTGGAMPGGAMPGGASPGGSIRAGHGREEEREVTAASRDKPFPARGHRRRPGCRAGRGARALPHRYVRGLPPRGVGRRPRSAASGAAGAGSAACPPVPPPARGGAARAVSLPEDASGPGGHAGRARGGRRPPGGATRAAPPSRLAAVISLRPRRDAGPMAGSGCREAP